MRGFRKLGDHLKEKDLLGALQPSDMPVGQSLPFGCEKCDGYGNLVDENGARPCECKLNYFRKRRLEAALPPQYRRMTFESFKQETRAQKNILSTVKLYVNRYSKEHNKGLLLWGAPGSGKTHLAIAALQELIARGYDVGYYNTNDVLRQIRQTFQGKSAEEEIEAIRENLDREILLLDDFGSTRITGWVYDEIYSIINLRYERNKTLIITTRDFDVLAERIGDAVYSRFLEMCIIKHCGDEDFRERNLAEILSVDDLA